jgi:hypothetical protein
MKSLAVRATRASKKDPSYSFTVRTTQFPKDLVFSPGDSYVFEYRDGTKIVLKASRNGDTLYTGKVAKHDLPLPEVGKPVTHYVQRVYKQLKTLSV